MNKTVSRVIELCVRAQGEVATVAAADGAARRGTDRFGPMITTAECATGEARAGLYTAIFGTSVGTDCTGTHRIG